MIRSYYVTLCLVVLVVRAYVPHGICIFGWGLFLKGSYHVKSELSAAFPNSHSNPPSSVITYSLHCSSILGLH